MIKAQVQVLTFPAKSGPRFLQNLWVQLFAAWILSLVFAGPLYSQSAIPEVWLKDQVMVSGRTIYLRDVMQFDHMASEEQMLLGNIELAPSPVPGQIKHFHATAIRKVLQLKNIDDRSMEFKGNHKVAVSTKGFRVEGSLLENACRAFILEHLPWDQENVVLEFRKQVPAQIVRFGDVKVLISPLSKGLNVGNVALTVNIFSNGLLEKSVRVPVFVRVFDHVAVSLSYVARGQALGEHNVQVQRREITSLSRGLFHDLSPIVGRIAATNIRPGELLNARMLRKANAIKRGALVELVLSSLSLDITTKGVAQQDGGMGDWINVVNVDSGKNVLAQVVGTSTVRVA